jgi:putative hydrolase of the HAD superfamily
MIGARETAAERLPTESLERIRLEAFRETLRNLKIGDDSLASRLNDMYRSYRADGIELFDDVLPVLEMLRRRYRLGLLSNGNTDPGACGLGKTLSFVVFAYQYGVEKPDSALFLVAAREAGCRSEAMLHVGDSIRDDVLGARAAGILPVWLNRSRAEPESVASSEWEIESLWELLELL